MYCFRSITVFQGKPAATTGHPTGLETDLKEGAREGHWVGSNLIARGKKNYCPLAEKVDNKDTLYFKIIEQKMLNIFTTKNSKCLRS